MAYWWVAQGTTYRQERTGGYLWAPKRGKNDTLPFHWANMTSVEPGDIIFSYLDQAISAVAIAQSRAYSSDRPSEIIQPWHYDGFRIDAEYTPIQPSLAISRIAEPISMLLPKRYSPLTKRNIGAQGYLFSLPPKAGRFLRDKVSDLISMENIQSDAILKAPLQATTRKAIVDARLGHGEWRKQLLRSWSGRCAASGLDVAPLLRASHIKPWCDSNNAERLDERNGLLLSAMYDAAFDAGFISFKQDGEISISSSLSVAQAEQAGISSKVRLRCLNDGHVPYLMYHQDVIFKS